MDKPMNKNDSLIRRYLGISFCIAVLFLSSIIGCPAKRKSTLKIPEGSVGIIAYGSLISLKSMEQSLGHKYEGPVHEVHLTGYERVWTCVRPWNDPQAVAAGAKKIDAYLLRDTERVPIIGAAELNIYPKRKGRINGVLYLMTEEELLRLDKREWSYRRVDATDKIEEFRFLDGKVYVYEGLPRSPQGSSEDNGTYILIKEFLDLVTGACNAKGEDFRNEFDKSTRPCAFPVVSYKNIIWEKAK